MAILNDRERQIREADRLIEAERRNLQAARRRHTAARRARARLTPCDHCGRLMIAPAGGSAPVLCAAGCALDWFAARTARRRAEAMAAAGRAD